MADGFSGMDQLIADMAKLPDELKGEAAKHILAEANGMQADVRQGYPRGETGNLIKGVVQRQRGPLAIQVVSRAPHAHLYEFGHAKRGPKGGRVAGKPTFIPAKYRHLKRLFVRFEEMLRRVKVRGMTGSAA